MLTVIQLATKLGIILKKKYIFMPKVISFMTSLALWWHVFILKCIYYSEIKL